MGDLDIFKLNVEFYFWTKFYCTMDSDYFKIITRPFNVQRSHSMS